MQSIAAYVDTPYADTAYYFDAFLASEFPYMWKLSRRMFHRALCWHFFSLLNMQHKARLTVPITIKIAENSPEGFSTSSFKPK